MSLHRLSVTVSESSWSVGAMKRIQFSIASGSNRHLERTKFEMDGSHIVGMVEVSCLRCFRRPIR